MTQDFHYLFLIEDATVYKQPYFFQANMNLGGCLSLLGLHNIVLQTGRFKPQKFISQSSRGFNYKSKVSEGLVSPEVSLLGLQTTMFFLWPHLVFYLYEYIPDILPVLIRIPVLLG